MTATTATTEATPIKASAETELSRIATGLVNRLQLAQSAGMQFGGLRDMYATFGWKVNVTSDDFLAKYNRQDITSRIIDAPPTATWANPPEIIENDTALTEWKRLDRKVKLWNAMYRADRLARLNPFSLLIFGFDDSGDMSRPLSPKGVKELLYVRAVGARLVEDMTFIEDVTNPRYGRPDVYTIQFDDPKAKTATSGRATSGGKKRMKVHHSRVVHIVENPLEDTVFSVPIIEKIYNLLDDLLKVAGGTAETYWLTGNRGMQADVDPEMDFSETDADALSDEIDEYVHQLRRIIRTRGVKLNPLESKPPNPKETFDMVVTLISGTTGIPKRILLGSEAGQLASEQDRANWAERIDERRRLFAEPWMLEPIVDLLQFVGVLPEGDIEFEWPSAFIMSPLEENQAMAQIARAIGNISRQTGNKAPMQLTSRTEARELIGLKGDLAEKDIIEPPEEPVAQPFGGGANPAKKESPTSDGPAPTE